MLLEIVSVDRESPPKASATLRGIRVNVPSVPRCRQLLEHIGAVDEKKLRFCEGQGRIQSVELELGGRRITVDSLGAVSAHEC